MPALDGTSAHLWPHPDGKTAMLEGQPDVIAYCRSHAAAPSLWYAPSLSAYLLKRRDVPLLVRGLEAAGCHVTSDIPSETTQSVGERPGFPPWCGECDERTRQREAPDYGGNPAVMRCPSCHPLAGKALRPPGLGEGGTRLAEERVAEHVARVRDTLDRSQATMRDRRRQNETLDVPTQSD